jgi:hypothetical protein
MLMDFLQEWSPIMGSRHILCFRELICKVRDNCDLCHKYKLLEYLAMDEENAMLTICKECCEHHKKNIDTN